MKIEYDYTSEISYFKTDSSDLTTFKRSCEREMIEWKFKFKGLWFKIDDELLIHDLENYLFPDKTPCEIAPEKFIILKVQKVIEERNMMLESLKALM